MPEKTFFSNLRKVLSEDEWDILRKAVYKKDKYRCVICEAQDIQLEAHESWQYDYQHSIQLLENIISLCHMCHLNNHLWFAKILIEEESLDKQDLIDHWCRVNQEKAQHFAAYEKKVFRLWKLRDKFDWNIIDPYGNFILDGVSLNTLLKFIKSKI